MWSVLSNFLLITRLGFVEQGVERIVDQVVNPKVIPTFLPQVEEAVYHVQGLPRPPPVEEQPQYASAASAPISTSMYLSDNIQSTYFVID